jgi:hypothetical protein
MVNIIKSIRNLASPLNTVWIDINYEIGYFDCNPGEVTEFVISNKRPKDAGFI